MPLLRAASFSPFPFQLGYNFLTQPGKVVRFGKVTLVTKLLSVLLSLSSFFFLHMVSMRDLLGKILIKLYTYLLKSGTIHRIQNGNRCNYILSPPLVEIIIHHLWYSCSFFLWLIFLSSLLHGPDVKLLLLQESQTSFADLCFDGVFLCWLHPHSTHEKTHLQRGCEQSVTLLHGLSWCRLEALHKPDKLIVRHLLWKLKHKNKSSHGNIEKKILIHLSSI